MNSRRPTSSDFLLPHKKKYSAIEFTVGYIGQLQHMIAQNHKKEKRMEIRMVAILANATVSRARKTDSGERDRLQAASQGSLLAASVSASAWAVLGPLRHLWARAEGSRHSDASGAS